MTEPTDRRLRSEEDLGSVRFDDQGLVPVIAQDADTGAVLMVAWANQHALARTLASGTLHFWSRSRGELWKKGETSGNTLKLLTMHLDCDGDTVLALVDPSGPACHTGEATCFGVGASPGTSGEEANGEAVAPQPAETPGPSGADGNVLSALAEVIRGRNRERPEGSYTTRLLEDENLRLKKLGEELSELVAALVRQDPAAPEEAADLVYHVMVALEGAGSGWAEVEDALAKRRG